MSEYTKGEWRIEEQRVAAREAILHQLGGCGRLLGVSAFKSETYADTIAVMLPNGEEIANARLIAAAPDLLEACEGDALDEALRLIKESTFSHKPEVIKLLNYKQSLIEAAIAKTKKE